MIIVHSRYGVKPLDASMPERHIDAGDFSDPMVARILDAAEQCVQRYGIRRTAMGEVSRVGRLSRGSIYRHFGDKQALMDGVFARRQDIFLDRTEALLERESTLVDKVALTVMAGRRDMRDGLFARLADIEPETVASMLLEPRFYRRSVAFWPPHVRRAVADGEIPADADVAVVADLIVRLAASLVMFRDMGVKLASEKSLRAYLRAVLGVGSSA